MQYAASEPETIEAAWIASHMPRRSPPRDNNNIALTPLIGFAYCLGAKQRGFFIWTQRYAKNRSLGKCGIKNVAE